MRDKDVRDKDVRDKDVRDKDVRVALHRLLSEQHAGEPDAMVLDELGLCGRVRVDVAVVNGLLAGYEIKSAADTLRRLPGQVAIYSEVLDHAHLVVARCHLEQASAVVPSWWGVSVAAPTGGEVVIEQVRPARRNTAVVNMSLAQLLWREEALELLERRGADHGVRTKARWHVWTRLAEVLTTDEMRGAVRAALTARQGWRAGR